MQELVPYKSKLKYFDRLIIGITLFFFPVGIIIALIRVLSTHFYHSRRGRNYRLIGWVLLSTFLAIMALIYLTYDEFGPEEAQEFGDLTLAFGIVLVIPAIVFAFLAGNADRKFNFLMRQYRELVILRGITEIDHLAVETRQSPYHVMRDLDFMINEKVLPFGRIENGVLELELEGYHNDNYAEAYDEEYVEVYDEEKEDAGPARGPKSIECPSCGARVVVNTNEEKECEYCGNVIVA